jgi:hypothetical protein
MGRCACRRMQACKLVGTPRPDFKSTVDGSTTDMLCQECSLRKKPQWLPAAAMACHTHMSSSAWHTEAQLCTLKVVNPCACMSCRWQLKATNILPHSTHPRVALLIKAEEGTILH